MPFRLTRKIRRAAPSPEEVAEFLCEETTSGKLLLIATGIALLWANVSLDSYSDLWGADLSIGPDWLHLHLTLGDWIADGLLAIFFFVAGMEVKRELTIGELAGRREAALPLFAAAGGMVVPALVAIAVSGGDATEGGAWAVPVATDIAFALGVLAIAGSALPAGVRVLLLSMAVIDDLGAIALIAILFTNDLSLLWLLGGLAFCGVYWLLLRERISFAWLLWALAVGAWVCIHASGVHATVAGILLGLLTPVRRQEGEERSPARRFEHRLHPLSAGVCVPLFALAAAGIPLAAAGDSLSDPIALGIIAGLVVGKFTGIFGGAWLAVKLRLGALPGGIGWADVAPVAMLGGIGYTVSLLVTQLAFDDIAAQERAAIAVLEASLIASVVAVVMLRMRHRAHERSGAVTDH